MKKDKQQSSFVNIGSSSLLIIFLVLCLSTFAILSLSSAKSDYSFSERLADHKTEYYEASSRAETITEKIDDILSETAAGADPSDSVLSSGNVAASAYGAAVMSSLNGTELEGVVLSCNSEEDDLTVSFEVPLNQKQALSVSLLVTDYVRVENYYEIKSWRVVSTGSWDGDQPLNLIQMTD